MVKYEGTTLIMDAWITNGFDYAVYNIHDVTLRISNEEGVIADAYFDELTDLRSERVSRLFGPSTFVQIPFKCSTPIYIT